jgi:hypothetical protein
MSKNQHAEQCYHLVDIVLEENGVKAGVEVVEKVDNLQRPAGG